MSEPKAGGFASIGRSMGKRPAVYAVASGLILIVLAIGSLSLRPTFNLGTSGVPSTAESVTAMNTLEKGFPPGQTEPTQVLLHATSGTLTSTTPVQVVSGPPCGFGTIMMP